MQTLRTFARRFVLVTGVVVSLAGFDAAAQSPPSVDALREQFPASSIDSVTKADAALAATSGAKGRAEQDFRTNAQACLRKVLVNTCLDGARAQRRKRMEDIDAVELEANRYKRQDKATRVEADRTRREAERVAKSPADTAQREVNRKAYDTRQAEAQRAAADRAKSQASRSASAKTHKPAGNVPSSGADAAQRQKNATAYAARVKAAEEHRVELDRRLVEKTADRKRRADAKAAKDAKSAAAAAARSPAPAPVAPKP